MSVIAVIVVAGHLLLAPQLLGQVVIDVFVVVLNSEQRLLAWDKAVTEAPGGLAIVECPEDRLQLCQRALLLQGRHD